MGVACGPGCSPFPLPRWPAPRRCRCAIVRAWALTISPGSPSSHSASSGIGRVVGDADRLAARGDRAAVDQRERVRSGCSAGAQVVQFVVRCPVLRGDVGQQCHEHQRGARHPPAPARVAGGSSSPAAEAGAAEDAQQRRREEGVARVDRQSDAREGGEDEHRHDAQRWRPAARAWRSHNSVSTPPSAAPSSTAGRRISPMRRGMYSGTFAIPVSRASVSRGVARVGQRPQRVAGDQPVARHPEQRRATGTSSASQASCRGVAGRDPASSPLQASQCAGGARRASSQLEPVAEPEKSQASGRSRPASASSASTGAPAARAARLDRHEQGAQNEQQVGHVDVGAHPVGEHRDARQQQQRRHSPGGASNQSAPSRYTAHAHADSARKPSATVTPIARAPSGESTKPSASTSGCGVGAIGMPYCGVCPRASCRPRRARRGCRSSRTPRHSRRAAPARRATIAARAPRGAARGARTRGADAIQRRRAPRGGRKGARAARPRRGRYPLGRRDARVDSGAVAKTAAADLAVPPPPPAHLRGRRRPGRRRAHAAQRGGARQVHHAYLFVGSRGTGKTSMAKILAACLNCEQRPHDRALRQVRIVPSRSPRPPRST